ILCRILSAKHHRCNQRSRSTLCSFMPIKGESGVRARIESIARTRMMAHSLAQTTAVWIPETVPPPPEDKQRSTPSIVEQRLCARAWLGGGWIYELPSGPL